MIHECIIPRTADSSMPFMVGGECPRRIARRITTCLLLKRVFSINNVYRNSKYLLKKLVASPSRLIELMKITVVIILFPIITVPLLITAVVKNILDIILFPFQ
ncbi:MAG: hypothetical protein KAG53_09990 [Endozoicomonadaceae bacterium]|nr:hypothetical protein [Endozoicomonadaceae bacterium]